MHTGETFLLTNRIMFHPKIYFKNVCVFPKLDIEHDLQMYVIKNVYKGKRQLLNDANFSIRQFFLSYYIIIWGEIEFHVIVQLYSCTVQIGLKRDDVQIKPE